MMSLTDFYKNASGWTPKNWASKAGDAVYQGMGDTGVVLGSVGAGLGALGGNTLSGFGLGLDQLGTGTYNFLDGTGSFGGKTLSGAGKGIGNIGYGLMDGLGQLGYGFYDGTRSMINRFRNTNNPNTIYDAESYK